MANPTFDELVVLIQNKIERSRLSQFGFKLEDCRFEVIDKIAEPGTSRRWTWVLSNEPTKRQIEFSFVEYLYLLRFCVSNLAADPMYDYFFLNGYCLGEKIPNIENEAMKIPDPKDQINFIFDSIEKLLDGRLGSILLGKEWVDYPIDYGGYK